MPTCQSGIRDSPYENATVIPCCEPAVALMQCYHRFEWKKVDSLVKYMCRFHVPRAESGNYHYEWRMCQDLGYNPPTREEYSRWINSF